MTFRVEGAPRFSRLPEDRGFIRSGVFLGPLSSSLYPFISVAGVNVTLVTQHYHIRWSSSKLDWQAFHTEEDAKADAERLKGPDEKYVIEAQNDCDCPRRNEIRPKKA